jgi:hypothetical protein
MDLDSLNLGAYGYLMETLLPTSRRLSQGNLVQEKDRSNIVLGKFGVKPDSKIHIRYCAKSEARLKT